MPNSFNGIGTRYIGMRDFGLDGSFLTTEWVTFAYLPLFPIRSRRIVETGNSKFKYYLVVSTSSVGYFAGPDQSPVLRQVLYVYGWVYGLLALLFNLPHILSIVRWPAISLLAILPFVLRRYARSHAKAYSPPIPMSSVAMSGATSSPTAQYKCVDCFSIFQEKHLASDGLFCPSCGGHIEKV